MTSEEYMRSEWIEGEIGDAQSIDGRIRSRRISNDVPSMKRMLRTGLDGEV